MNYLGQLTVSQIRYAYDGIPALSLPHFSETLP